MTDKPDTTDPVAILRDLGLKEYEARCLVALARMPAGTAKEISEVADVPRTRVYDAVDELQSYGLVDVQQSNPQCFRAISVEETVALLRRRFDRRFENLHAAFDDLEPVAEQPLEGGANVWSTTGSVAVSTRAGQFVDEADEEVVLVIDGGGEELTPEHLFERLRAAVERGVTVYIGALDDETHERVRAAVPDAAVFESGLEWLQPQTESEDERIGRLLLVDRDTLLLGSIGAHSPEEETAIWSDDVGNVLVVIGRRLLATGLDSETADFGTVEDDSSDATEYEP